MRSILHAVALFICLLAASSSRAADTARVLFIGNSFTGVNDLPETLRLLAASAGDVVIKQSNTPGGYTLMGHSTNAQTLSLIDAGGWDFVVLQEQSQRPAFPDAQFQQDVVPYAKILSQRVRQHNPCARIVFYNTWGYKNGDAGNCAFFPPLCTYHGMDSMLRLRYRILADSNDAFLSPVGPVWRHIRATFPGIELYDADNIHPSVAGTYAAACAFYAIVFGKSPVPAAYAPAGISAANATAIRQSGETVGYDSLAYWRQLGAPLPAPTAAFTRVVNGLSVAFTSISTGATSYRWSFGDGNFATTQSPTHVYGAPGVYMVKLVVKSGCRIADSTTQTLFVQTTGAPDVDQTGTLRIDPNPTTGNAWLTGVPKQAEVAVIDVATGRTVATRQRLGGGSMELPFAGLPAGVYVVRIRAAGATTVLRVVRR